MKTYHTLFYALIITMAGFSQGVSDPLELELKDLRNKVMKSTDDVEKIRLNGEFRIKMKAFMGQSSFDHTMDSIPKIGVLKSPDDKFRLICWNVAFENGTFSYYCFVQLQNRDESIIYELNDYSDKLERPQFAVTRPNQWFGCLYYEIIPYKEGGITKYLLLGWDGNDHLSNMKIIDVLLVDGMDIQFGARSFKEPYVGNTRIFFEYNEQAVMSLQYDEKLKMIVFDHLIPRQPNLEGMYEFYIPDLSFDGLKFEKDGWYLKQDIDARNNRKMGKYNAPPPAPINR